MMAKVEIAERLVADVQTALQTVVRDGMRTDQTPGVQT
jgi:hypothetical protein